MNQRPQRIADGIKDLLSQIFYQKIRDPRLKHIWITSVRVNADLQIAKVYYRLKENLGSEKPISKKDIEEGLRVSAGYLRSQVAAEIPLKRTPILKFYFDESIERGGRIEELLSGLSSEKK